MYSFISKLLRAALAGLFVKLVDKGFLTNGQVDQILLALAVFISVVGSHVVSWFVHQIKLKVAADSPAGTEIEKIKQEAWELFLIKLKLLKPKA